MGPGDLVTAAKAIWTVYESIAGGAAKDFNSFLDEFRSIKDLLEKLEEVKGSTSNDGADLGAFYDQTLRECAKFVETHKKLAQDEALTAGGHRHSLGTKVSTLFEKSIWPLEQDEAEKLRRKLERCLKMATLKSTEETRGMAIKIIREAEHGRLENLEMLKSIKTMTAQISSLLRWCVLEGPTDADSWNMMHNMTHLHYRSRPALPEPGHELRMIPEDEELFVFERQGSLEILDRIRETSERLDNLVRRLNPHDASGRKMEQCQPPGRAYTLESMSDGAPTVAPVAELLHQASDDVRAALEIVGYKDDFVPSHDSSQKGHDLAGHPGSQNINEAAEEWEQFRQWLDFQFKHTFNTIPDDHESRNSISRVQSSSLLSSSPETGLPGIFLSRTSTRESDLESQASPLYGPSVFIPDRRVQLTEHPVQIEFPHPDVAHRTAFRSLTCTVTAVFNAQNEPEAIEAVDIHSGAKVTQKIQPSSHQVQSSMLPYMPSRRVSRSFSEDYVIWFQGSHRTKIEEEQRLTRLRMAPVYRCHDRKDFYDFQKALLKRRVIHCIDVRNISVNTGEYHCNSAETVRILEDPITKSRSLLYFASYPGTGRCAKFVDMQVTEFGKPHAKSKHVKLPYNSISRRSSIESATSVLSQESRHSISSKHSLSTSPGSSKREKYLEFEFFEAADCTKFVKALRDGEEILK
ncbi:uncharacterized protein BO80DRAFT_388894 [Aspergillus ibericus CBS 121593]|uniref:Fungal N-terminal domain-containing protein n=1 Tax=Aspergillus ibericus CBS 121593 TaxID=1448316 RepID=A0A395GQQ3_9EURO|nr:hypothetical protein BO80DRAFT_388894 [Aspergillus ibericus CBS 121593]RAK97855.1 hypothetical protein BO80DRAFT_388894 [Aspergillus ibericus CBS 121593]